MSTLTSASTDAQVEAAYDNNASYFEDSSPSKCLAFITACMFLLRRRAPEYSIAGRSVKRETIAAELEQAKIYSRSRSNGRSRVKRVAFQPGGVD